MDVCNLRYEGYSTGCYGQHKAGGVTLQFFCVVIPICYFTKKLQSDPSSFMLSITSS